MKTVQSFALAFLLLLPSPVFAAHPLITDDAGTQGAGKFQLELTGEYARKDDDEVLERNTLGTAALTYGVSDTVDLAVAVPWLRSDVDDAGQPRRPAVFPMCVFPRSGVGTNTRV